MIKFASKSNNSKNSEFVIEIALSAVFDEASIKSVVTEIKLLKELKPHPDIGKYFKYW